MNTVPLPSSSAHNLLALAGLGVLAATLGCQLGEADVVHREPSVGNGMGGSGGSDTILGADSMAMDSAILDLPAIDTWSTTDGVSTTDEGGVETAAADTGSTNDSPDTPDAIKGRDQAGTDSADLPDGDGGGRDVPDPCGTSGYEFCYGFDDLKLSSP